MKTAMTDIDAHLRTRLRVIIWKQWKVPSKRQWGLQKLGIGKDLARLTSYCGDRYQWVVTKTCVVRAISKEKLAQGERIREVLKQPQYKPMPVEYQVIIIYAATKKYLLDIEVDSIRQFEKELFDFIDTKYSEVPKAIREEKQMSEETEATLIKAIEEFKKEFRG